ncbi:MAG TPA: F0F1 ATP synthase subunit epsilon [Vicinamibacterales bacterium]|nr:F0F1 ATP synthase subunit epsilon [Vicinamibacterales bacterium]
MAVPRIPERLSLHIVTPEHSLVHEEVDEVVMPGADGYFGVLPGHTPLLTSLQVGVLWYRKGQEKVFLAVAFGFAEVMPDRVMILAQVAERAEDIDVTRAQSAHDRAEQYLSRPTSEVDFERARIALLKSLTRLQVSTRARTRA